MSNFSLTRRCPVCGEKLSFSDVMRPAFKSKGEAVQCPHCQSVVSEPWSKYSWLPMMGLGIGLLVPGWLSLLFVLIAAIILMYLLVPLKKI